MEWKDENVRYQQMTGTPIHTLTHHPPPVIHSPYVYVSISRNERPNLRPPSPHPFVLLRHSFIHSLTHSELWLCAFGAARKSESPINKPTHNDWSMRENSNDIQFSIYGHPAVSGSGAQREENANNSIGGRPAEGRGLHKESCQSQSQTNYASCSRRPGGLWIDSFGHFMNC